VSKPASVPAPAALALADGTVYRGIAWGARRVQAGEVCFNTSMMGYQEILTDPSYAGQIVTMTYTQIGNVGANAQDDESARPFLRGFVVKEMFAKPSNFRSQETLPDFLTRFGVPAISGLDTRALVRRIRDSGFQNGALSTDPEHQGAEELVERARNVPGLEATDLAFEVSCKQSYHWDEQGWAGVDGQLPRAARPSPTLRVVAYDFGVKRNILRRLVDQGFDVTVVPSRTSAAEVRALKPDAVFLSNGPGDPAAVQGIREHVRSLADDLPIFGICLGHQILGLALGGTTKKLKFGHPAGQGSRDGEGRHLCREPRVCGGCGFVAPRWRARRDHAHQSERRNGGGARASTQAALFRAVPPGSVAGPARRRLFLFALSRDDGSPQERRTSQRRTDRQGELGKCRAAQTSTRFS
jgi:carbamoyl-phosphate synthase small subunit